MAVLDINFTQATDTQQLARMLQDFFFRHPEIMKEPESSRTTALWEHESHANTEDVKIGRLVQVYPSNMVKVAGGTVHATGIVTAYVGDMRVKWATDAWMWLKPLGTLGSGFQELWLTAGGGITMDQPTTGILQKVGFVLNYDATSEEYLCRIQIGPPLGINLGS